MEALFVDIFLDGHTPERRRSIVLDLDATDDTIHAASKKVGSSMSYYDSYCWSLPLYIFCGRFLLGRQAAPRQHADGRPLYGAVDERRPGSSQAASNPRPAGR